MFAVGAGRRPPRVGEIITAFRMRQETGWPMSSAFNRHEFVRFSLEQGVLRFGQFKVKSGRMSPYFFNAGLFNTGRSVGRLAQFYAQALADSGLQFNMLFG